MAHRACDGVNSPSISYYLSCGKGFVKQSFFLAIKKMGKRGITTPLPCNGKNRFAGRIWHAPAITKNQILTNQHVTNLIRTLHAAILPATAAKPYSGKHTDSKNITPRPLFVQKSTIISNKFNLPAASPLKTDTDSFFAGSAIRLEGLCAKHGIPERLFLG